MLVYASSYTIYLLTELQLVEDFVMKQSNSPISRYFYFLDNTALLTSEVERNERTIFIQKAIPSSSGCNVLNMDKSVFCYYTDLLLDTFSYYIFSSHLLFNY